VPPTGEGHAVLRPRRSQELQARHRRRLRHQLRRRSTPRTTKEPRTRENSTQKSAARRSAVRTRPFANGPGEPQPSPARSGPRGRSALEHPRPLASPVAAPSLCAGRTKRSPRGPLRAPTPR
jgi:hypothetical protein